MNFKEFGDPNNPHIMLIHGGGNAWWNFKRQAKALEDSYYVILPTLDGHGDQYLNEYVSTNDCAKKILDYIDTHCNGHLFAISGVSLGGQIVIELLSLRENLVKKAIIDGCICYPQILLARFSIATISLFHSFMFSKNTSKFLIDIMPKILPKKMWYPEDIKRLYIQDIPLTPKKTLVTMYKTYMMNYNLSDNLKNTTATVQYWYGEKEMKCVKNSALKFQELVPSTKIYEAKGYNHGYLALYLPNEWLILAIAFFNEP